MRVCVCVSLYVCLNCHVCQHDSVYVCVYCPPQHPLEYEQRVCYIASCTPASLLQDWRAMHTVGAL